MRDLDAALPRPRTRARRIGEVVACSLVVTALAALVGLAVAISTDVRWNYAFVIARWICIFTLILVAVVNQVAERTGRSWRAPWVLRTPATVLLLMCESIGFDIISAQFG
ncbi:MAG: hypothetical protein JWL76_1239 [Thermoleophilia bacterium]|nr:hypothetical protein [Thermoleophilia bacterium]